MKSIDNEAASIVRGVAIRCPAVRCVFLTDEVRRAILYQTVLSPISLSTGNAEWLLALARAVDDFVLPRGVS